MVLISFVFLILLVFKKSWGKWNFICGQWNKLILKGLYYYEQIEHLQVCTFVRFIKSDQPLPISGYSQYQYALTVQMCATECMNYIISSFVNL